MGFQISNAELLTQRESNDSDTGDLARHPCSLFCAPTFLCSLTNPKGRVCSTQQVIIIPTYILGMYEACMFKSL